MRTTVSLETGARSELARSGAEIKIPNRNNSRNPDLLVCTRAQWQIVRAQTKAEFLSDNSPLLTIEIVSPNSIEKDTQELIAEYAEAKVLEYWIVNSLAETVSVYVLDGQIYSLKGEFAGEQTVHSELLEHWSATAVEMLG